MNKLPAETLAQIAMLAPTCAAYRNLQLTYAAFDPNPCKQFWVRNRFRTWITYSIDNYPTHSQVLPHDRYDGRTIATYKEFNECEYYVNGVQHGACILLQKTGMLRCRHTLRHGMLHGEYTSWRLCGTIRVHAHYEFGKRHGEYTAYNSDGSEAIRCMYNHGIPVIKN